MENEEVLRESIVVSVSSSRDHVDRIEKQDPVIPTVMWRARVVEICSEVPNLIWRRLNNLFKFFVRLDLEDIKYILACLCFPFVWVAYKWKRVFIVSCVSVSFDTLFLYIPIIDQEHKCLGSDKTLRNVALVLRSLTDLTFILHIFILKADQMSDTKWPDDSNSDYKPASWLQRKLKLVRDKMPEWLSINIIVNFLAILPIPQVTIVVGYFRMGSSNHFLKYTILNVFIVLQYSLRFFQIFLSIKKMDEKVGKWVRCTFYFLLYIIASHVLAAFWYFFSIQREISCWDQACRRTAGCTPIYDCGRNTSLNSQFLNKVCPIESPNVTLFDFGMFLDILQSGNTGYASFSRKFFYSFWWGLKNLSNFGTNIETSSYIWENCFAILICIIGLLLFLFLIGNVQTYIQSEAAEFIKVEQSIQEQLSQKKKDIENWMSIHDIPPHVKNSVTSEELIKKLIGKEVNTKSIDLCRSFFREKSLSDLLSCVCVNALKKIPILEDKEPQDLKPFTSRIDDRTFPSLITREDMDPQDSKLFTGRLSYLRFITKEKSSSFPRLITVKKDNYIIKVGDKIERMYLVIDGITKINDSETTSTTETRRPLYKYHGEELLYWALQNFKKKELEYDPHPVSKVDIKCQTKIEAFQFYWRDLFSIVSKLDNVEQLVLEMPHLGEIRRPLWTIEEWMSSHYLPYDMKIDIWDNIKSWVKDTKVDTVTMQDCYYRSLVKVDPVTYICMKALKNVPILGNIHKQDLKVFWEYNGDEFPTCIAQEKDSYITRAGQELDTMWLIIDGVIEWKDGETTYSSQMSTPKTPCQYGYVGEEVLRWAILNCEKEHRDRLPRSTLDVKCQTKIGAFSFSADELIEIVKKLKNSEHLEALAASHDSKKMQTDRQIKYWLLRNGFPEDLKANIMRFPYKLVVEENMHPDVDVEFLFGILPEYIKPPIKRHLGMNAFKKVPMLQYVPEYVLEIISNLLEPVVYEMNSDVIRAGEKLGLMIIILGGTIILTDATSSNATTTTSSEITQSSYNKILKEGSLYGEQLLSWASPNKISYSDHPISTQNLKCETKVEALIIKAEDLRNAVSRCGSQWNVSSSINSQHLLGDGRDNVVHTRTLAPTTTVEQTIQLHQGHDMLLQQLILIRETMFQLRDDQGRRLDDQARKLDDLATFLAKLGYTGTSSPPPAP